MADNGRREVLGVELETCEMGEDCPFAPAMQRLKDEQHQRIRAESALACSLDAMADKLQNLTNELESLRRKVADYAHELQSHVARHRRLDTAIIVLASVIGGALAKVLLP